MPNEPIDAAILTLKEVSEYLKVTERTIYRLAASRKIPAFKVGGSWRFSRADIDLWIRRQSDEVSGTDELSNKGETGDERTK